MNVREFAHLLTNDTFRDPLQLFAETGHCLDRCPFRKHWENNIVQHKANHNIFTGDVEKWENKCYVWISSWSHSDKQ